MSLLGSCCIGVARRAGEAAFPTLRAGRAVTLTLSSADDEFSRLDRSLDWAVAACESVRDEDAGAGSGSCTGEGSVAAGSAGFVACAACALGSAAPVIAAARRWQRDESWRVSSPPRCEPDDHLDTRAGSCEGARRCAATAAILVRPRKPHRLRWRTHFAFTRFISSKPARLAPPSEDFTVAWTRRDGLSQPVADPPSRVALVLAVLPTHASCAIPYSAC